MIYLYSGTPGSGKSYHAMVNIRQQLKRKRPVLTNFPVNDNRVSYIKDVTADGIVGWSRQVMPERYRESYSLVVIDEAQLFLNSRTWQQKDRQQWNTLFSQHRKLCMDIILVAQSDVLIDKQIRILIEYDVRHRKALGVLDLATGKIMIARKYWYGHDEVVGQRWLIGRKAIYNMYDTTALFGSLDDTAQSQSQ